MQTIHSKKELKQALIKIKHKTIGLVPTMGKLHKGHFKLIEIAQKQNEVVLISIFVNPTQFNDPNDLSTYPKDINTDIKNIKSLFPKATVFIPSVETMYEKKVEPKQFDLNDLDQVMEGVHRKKHFQGVATIVYKLFELGHFSNAYFGEKDFQQLQIIRLIANQYFPKINIIAVPTVRASSGLALSSRNDLLSKENLEKATLIYKTLCQAKQHLQNYSVNEVKNITTKIFEKDTEIQLEYFEIADEFTLKPFIKINQQIKPRAFIAARIGNVRLIDNMAL